MRYFSIILLVFTLFSCGGDPGGKIEYLDGYWEIKKVERNGEVVVEYRFNENVDFFEINDLKGIRKKVKPQLDGSYLVTEDAENIEVKIEDNDLFIYYTTAFDSWKERINTLTENHLELENQDGIIYHYERYTPLLKDHNEKE